MNKKWHYRFLLDDKPISDWEQVGYNRDGDDEGEEPASRDEALDWTYNHKNDRIHFEVKKL